MPVLEETEIRSTAGFEIEARIDTQVFQSIATDFSEADFEEDLLAAANRKKICDLLARREALGENSDLTEMIAAGHMTAQHQRIAGRFDVNLL